MKKRLFLITLLVLSSAPAYAEWVEIDSTDTYTIYADSDSIYRNGDLVQVWDLYDYKIARSVKDEKTFSLLNQVEYDCAEKRNRSLAFTFFSGPMRTGEALYADSHAGEWGPVPLGSIGQAIHQFACAKQ